MHKINESTRLSPVCYLLYYILLQLIITNFYTFTSVGDFYGQGHVRKKELFHSVALFGIPESRVFVEENEYGFCMTLY